MFRRIVGRPDDWNDPDTREYLDNQGDWKARLYKHGAAFYSDLSILVELWLTELQNSGLSSLNPQSGTGAKQPGPRPYDSFSTHKLYPVKVSGNKTVLLRLEGRRTPYGYKSIEILDEPLSTDAAILAALAVLEVPEFTEPNLNRLISLLREDNESPLGESIYGHVDKLLTEHKEHGHLSDRDVRFLEELDTRPFDFCLVLLRGRRAGFEDLARSEQLDLLKRAFTYIEPIVSNARKLAKFLEYGSPKGLSTRTLESAQKQIAAALMKDIAGFTLVQIADELGINKPRDWETERDVPQVRGLVTAGRKLLRDALGHAETDDLIRERKAELKRWNSLTDEQKREQKQGDWWANVGWPADLTRYSASSTDTSSNSSEDAKQEH